MKLIIEIQMDNEAFGDTFLSQSGEVNRILKRMVDKIYSGLTSGQAVDYNGNKVGQWEIKLD